ncbi:proteasome adapter and scaffold protein ECM29 [Dendroctonus ponderosae]|uniref:TOG domain-containing protein n=1 Tax=Dendroctonus ponderosae TaxID=77166 RepID=A0AAR5PGJ9_DENPD|nr:proteasome adapter and scaffold protein ECM29 [Dendroctonus ponderosae]
MDQTGEELMLLERVFLRLGSAESDEQLESVISKFLVPVLLELSSEHENVRKKVMELLIHINKRIKARSNVQLPVEALLTQYGYLGASSFVNNFTIIYLRSGFPRLSIEKQVELVPVMITALRDKPTSHLDSLLLLIVPLLGKVKVPTEPEKIRDFFGFSKSPEVTKLFLDILLDAILLPYSSLTLQSQEAASSGANSITIPVPPGMSENSFKRITANNSFKPEEFESIKLGIVKFLSHGIFKADDILLHFIVAASDTRFEVANFADMELKKVAGSVDWSSPHISQPIFLLFLGLKSNKPGQTKVAAGTRIRLKLLAYLCRVQEAGFVFPMSLQIIFDSLYGTNTNNKLKSLALNFTVNLIRYSVGDSLGKVAPILVSGLTKLIKEGELEHQAQAYVAMGLLVQKFPHTVFGNVLLLETYFNNLESANTNFKIQVREGMLNLIQAYKYDNLPDELDKDGRLNLIIALIRVKLVSDDSMVRFCCVRTLTTIFPPDHVPSKLLLLIAIGDREGDVSQEAFKSIYGTTRQNEFEMASLINKNGMPSFVDMIKHVQNVATTIMTEKKNIVHVGGHAIPFNINVYLEILLYLRLCLFRNLDIPISRTVLKHPCEHTPKISEAILNVYNGKEGKELLDLYLEMVMTSLLAQPGAESLSCLIELLGCVPNLHTLITDANMLWMQAQLGNLKEDIRGYVAVLYALVLPLKGNSENFDGAVRGLIEHTAKNHLETQHGALLAIGNCLEMQTLYKKRLGDSFGNKALVKDSLLAIAPFVKHKNVLLVGAAITSIGLIARVTSLPLDNGKYPDDGSPNPKKPAVAITKFELVQQLLDIMNNSKLAVKIREKAARSLGLMCVGEKFVHTKIVMEGLLNTAKETKDVEVHFTIGESLLMCCQTVSSPEARDAWQIPPDEYSVNSTDPVIDENLEMFLDDLLKLAAQPHPNSKQASCIWLLAVLNGCGKREPISKRLQIIQNTFMKLLCENNDIVQDVASKGLCVIYDSFKSEELLTALVNQLTLGTRHVAQVTSDTKLFEEGQLGSAPSGENLTTYKELCSLASDLNKPDLIYKFMHLANHNAMWNSKKGAAFGFSSIAQKCGEDLKTLMPEIVPKLFRYQFDPTPNIHDSMTNIWKVLVTDPQTTLDTYYHEILKDLLANINSAQYRVRQSCCLALQDVLKGSAHRTIHDAVDYMDELWSKLFRVMDDHHEATRISANKTARVLSKLCIRGTDSKQGKAGVKMMEAILPILLNTGITHTVSEIRIVSLQTVSELVNSAGDQIKPFLPKLIPALLQATGELESAKLSYFSTMMGARTEMQEAIDSARASIAKSHFTTETVSKSLRYADSSMLDELVPKVLELIKSSVGLGTRVACAHFITLLVVQLGADLEPFAGKILSTLVTGLTDRNSAIRKHNASAIGHLVSVCKPSSLEKLFTKLRMWYFEREDDSIRWAIACTIQSIGIHNQDVIKTYSTAVMPLVFFATHAEKSPETQHTLDLWVEIWSEHSPGTESGIRHNIEPICEMLKTALESASWTVKAQAANAVTTVASKLGSTLKLQHSNALLTILLAGLTGKTWKGKDKLLKALCSICTHCKDSLKAQKPTKIATITQAICRESRKQEVAYKIAALECLGDVVSSLEVDVFEDVYEILKLILDSTRQEDPEEEQAKNRENELSLKIAAYECLGKTWPENSPQTQEKYWTIYMQHCVEALPTVSRPIQNSILVALYSFVNKLYLLQKTSEQMSAVEKTNLGIVVNQFLQTITLVLRESKQTKMRKEVLNIIFCMATKLKQKNITDELANVTAIFADISAKLSSDNQPEIKCRLHDIKQLLN